MPMYTIQRPGRLESTRMMSEGTVLAPTLRAPGWVSRSSQQSKSGRTAAGREGRSASGDPAIYQAGSVSPIAPKSTR